MLPWMISWFFVGEEHSCALQILSTDLPLLIYAPFGIMTLNFLSLDLNFPLLFSQRNIIYIKFELEFYRSCWLCFIKDKVK